MALNFPKAIFRTKKSVTSAFKILKEKIYNLKFCTLPNYLPSACIKLGCFRTYKVGKTFPSYVPFKPRRKKTWDT